MTRQEDVSRDKGMRLVRLVLLLLRGPIQRAALPAELRGLYGANPAIALRRDLQTLEAALPPGARLTWRNRRREVALEGLGRIVSATSPSAGGGAREGGTITIDLADAGVVPALLLRLGSGTAPTEPPMIRVEMPLASGYTDHVATVPELERALRAGQSVRFTYRPPGKEPRQYERVQARRLVLRAGHLYLDAYNEQKQRDSDYRVDRIVPGSIVVLPFYHGQPRESRGILVRVRLLPPLSSGEISRRLEEQRVVERLDDGSAIIEGLARTLFEAQRLVLSYGALAEALEPASLRTRIAEDSRAMAAFYAEVPNRTTKS
jgi:hypothetical protein